MSPRNYSFFFVLMFNDYYYFLFLSSSILNVQVCEFVQPGIDETTYSFIDTLIHRYIRKYIYNNV